MKYKIDDQEYDVEVIKKNNKNTYLRVKDDLTILITTNFFTSKHSILKLLRDHEGDLRKMIARKCKEREKEENFYYLGQKYDIILVNTIKSVSLDYPYLYVKSKEMLERWLKKETKKVFMERLDYWYQQFEEEIPYPKLKIRKMKTRWGVCNKRDNSVTLNSRLMKYDPRTIDYVVVHELSHFIHFDHSRAFWDTVKKYYPMYKQVSKMLEE